MATDHKTVIAQINAGFAENNLEKVLSFCTDDFTWTMVGETKVSGKNEIRQWISSMNPEPPQFTIEDTVGEGDTVVTRGDMTMRERPEAPALPYSFCDVYKFRGEHVAELISFVVRTDKAETQSAQKERVEISA